MADVLKDSLQAELEKAKENLKDVDENIKRLTGRDPNDARINLRRVSAGGIVDARGRERILPLGGRRDSGGLEGPPSAKRRALGGAFSRLGPRTDSRRSRGEDSGDDDELPRKPTLQSSIVATPKEIKTRKDCLDEQKMDSKGLARNKRMFGLLLGTLQKFKDEETKKKEKEQKRVEIEQKLEAAAEKEREDLKRERQELFVERRRRQANLRRLEQKMEIVKQQEEWEQHHLQLLPFIQTKTKPPVFWLPAKHTSGSEERLKDSKKRLEEVMAERRSQTEEELQSMDYIRGATEEITETAEAEDELMHDESAIVQEVVEEKELEDDDDSKENNPDIANESEIHTPRTIVEEMPESEPMEVKTDVVLEKIENVEEKEMQETETEPITESAEKTEEEERLYDADQNLLTEKEFEPIYD